MSETWEETSMAQFRLHRSNDLTFLATLLSGRLAADPISDPMRPECIIIGHRGIEDWLTRTITQQLVSGLISTSHSELQRLPHVSKLYMAL